MSQRKCLDRGSGQLVKDMGSSKIERAGGWMQIM